jgi:hypothetical protein
MIRKRILANPGLMQRRLASACVSVSAQNRPCGRTRSNSRVLQGLNRARKKVTAECCGNAADIGPSFVAKMSLIYRCSRLFSGCYPPLFFGQKYRWSK